MNTGHLPHYTMTAFSRQIRALEKILRVLTQIDHQILMQIILLENFPHFLLLCLFSLETNLRKQNLPTPTADVLIHRFKRATELHTQLQLTRTGASAFNRRGLCQTVTVLCIPPPFPPSPGKSGTQ